MHEQCCDLLPAPLRGGTLEVQGLRNRLTGDGQLQGYTPGVQRRLGPWRALLRRAEPCIVGVGEESDNDGGDERGMQKGLHRTGALSVNLVQAMDGFVQLDAQFNFPTHPVQVSHLSWADPRREICEEEAVPLGRVDADKAEMERVLDAPDPHISIDGPAVELQDLLLPVDIEVGSRKKLLGDPPPGNRVDLGFPVVFEANDKAHPMGVTGAPP
jgi:hypothetical protein